MTIGLRTTFAKPFHRLLALYGREGAQGVLCKLADLAIRKIVPAKFSRVLWLDVEWLNAPGPVAQGFQFRFLSPEEVERYANDPTYLLDASMAERVRAGADLCYAALQGEKLAAFGWYALDSIEGEHADGISLSYPADVAFMYFGFTHPDYRGAPLHGAGMANALAEPGKRGVTKLVSFVDWRNWASLKSCYRLGYRDLGLLVPVGGPRRTLAIPPRTARHLGVRFGREASLRPRITLEFQRRLADSDQRYANADVQIERYEGEEDVLANVQEALELVEARYSAAN